MLNPVMGNSNVFDFNVYTEWAPGFVSLLLYLFDFDNMDFVVSEKCCHPCVQSVCTLKTGDTRLISHNVSKRYEAAVQRQCHLMYRTVRSGHRLSLLLHNHSL